MKKKYYRQFERVEGMARVLYIGWSGLPETAAGIRVYQIAKVLREAGNEVIFLCLSQPTAEKQDEIEYDGFRYILKEQSKSKIKNVENIFCGCADFCVIKDTIVTEKPDTVIVYNEKERLTEKIIAFCHSRGITVGADATEWYELSRSKKWNYVVAKNVDYRIRTMDSRLDYIISISPFLTAYYQSRGCKNVIEIPPIMDCVKSEIVPTSNRIRHMVYAGAPAQKDLILPYLTAIKGINNEQIKIVADIVGVTKEQVGTLLQIDDPEKIGIIAYGRVSHEECVKVIEKADFSILFRENLRYAKAGFSTKLSESLSLGIPVLCNAVGGADEIIKDGFNGIKIEGCDSASIMKAIERILLLDEGSIDAMKQRAIETAKQRFVGELYTGVLDRAVNMKP